MITIINIKKVIKKLLKVETIFVILSLLVFFFVFYNCFIDIEFSDAPMYLNYISQNINNKHINLFNLYTGLVGAEWDSLYLYQGYYHFTSFLCWLINIPHYLFNSTGYVENIAISTWSMGMLYNILSSMVFISIIKYFKWENKVIEYSVLIFTLFFSNFYYLRIAFSFYGNMFRTLLITLLIFLIYQWAKEEKDQLKYLFVLVVAAGLACSSSFLFISFTVLFNCLFIHQ
ncbi:MAG: hypothetical protein RR878_03370 [Anaerorhabdus sp.]|uniref:hypothetical protein n=2 Tax=Anaerorhabdus sp. TaxID=1872524 RepID=UPI002FC75959